MRLRKSFFKKEINFLALPSPTESGECDLHTVVTRSHSKLGQLFMNLKETVFKAS